MFELLGYALVINFKKNSEGFTTSFYLLRVQVNHIKTYCINVAVTIKPTVLNMKY